MHLYDDPTLGCVRCRRYPDYCAARGFDLHLAYTTLPQAKYFIGLLCPTSCQADTRDACGVCSTNTRIADGSSCGTIKA